MKTRAKTVLSFGTIGLIVAIVAIVATWPVQSDMRNMEGFHGASLSQILNIEADIREAVAESLAYVASGEQLHKDNFQAWGIVFEAQGTSFSDTARLMEPGEEEENALFQEIVRGQQTFVTASENMFREFEAKKAVNENTYAAFRESIEELITATERLVTIEAAEAESARRVAATSVSRIRWLMHILGLTALLSAIGIGLAVSRRNERSKEKSESRERQQAAVAELGKRALAASDLSKLFDEVVGVVAQILDVEYCMILESQPSGDGGLVKAGVGWKTGVVGQATVCTGPNSQPGHAIRTGKPVFVEDLPADSRFSSPSIFRDHGIVSGICAIIGSQETAWGVLGAHSKARMSLSQDDVRFVQSMANLLAVAIDREQTEEA